MRQRYWQFGLGSGGPVARHDSDQDDNTTPGPPYTVIVGRRTADNRGNDPVIRVHRRNSPEPLFSLNHGAARWLGVRLIEAAALDEAAGYIVADHEAETDIDRLTDWLLNNTVDQRLPAERSVDTAIRLLAIFKEQTAKGKVDGPDPREEAFRYLRTEAERVLARPSSTSVHTFQERSGVALTQSGISADEMVADLVSWLGPHKVSELRGIGAI